MSLADDIAAVLSDLRAEAEARMLDAITFTKPGAGDPAWNPTTGTYDPPTETVYTGPCRVRQANPAPQSTDAGEAQWSVDRVVVSLPWSDPASGAVVDGCTGTVTAAQDAAMVGLVVVAQAGHWQTDSTARRIPCQVVSRDAGPA